MRVGEVGKTVRIGADFDLSNNTSLAVTFTKPSGAVLNKTQADITIGSADTSTVFGTFKANEYWDYTFQTGELDEAGQMLAQLTYNGPAGEVFISDRAKINVLE